MEAVTIAAIASGAVTALAPLFKKTGEKLADKAGEEVFAQRGKIWETVEGLFPDNELTELNLFEKYPENKDIQTEAAAKIEEKLAANPESAKTLQELLAKLPKSEIKQNTLTITGDGNTAVQDVSGTVNINR